MSSYTVKMFSKSRPIHSNERFGDNQVKDLPSFKDIYWVLSWCEHFANKLFLQFYVSNSEISRVTLKGLKYFQLLPWLIRFCLGLPKEVRRTCF